jgi:hypothetical protein
MEDELTGSGRGENGNMVGAVMVVGGEIAWLSLENA